MGAVGLLYVGAVLFVNGLMLLGRVEARSAGVLNLFVGTLQVITPTVLIVQAGSDASAIFAASGIYLFGFTYLYVGIGLLAGFDSTGVGWFSLFVSVVALVFAALSFIDQLDYPFAVIWTYWSFLWFLFFLLLGLKKQWLTRYTGWVTIVQAWVTAVLPSFLLMTESYESSASLAVGLAAFGVIAFVVLWIRVGREPTVSTAATPRAEAEAGH